MQNSFGCCPGYIGAANGVGVLHIQQNVCDATPDVPSVSHFAVAADNRSLFNVVPPSEQELVDALLLGAHVDYQNSSECFRVLVTQNNVILRDAIGHRQQLLSGRVRASEESSRASSGCSSLVSSEGSTPSSGVGSSKRARVSPPRNFECPICHQFFNEKDFDRHISSWIAKCRTGANVVKAGHCAGIRDLSHPLLDHFDGESLDERVTQLVLDVRSLMHPGAYDAMSAQGSGRHVDVAKRFAQYLNQQ